jgi:hypothetical protein
MDGQSLIYILYVKSEGLCWPAIICVYVYVRAVYVRLPPTPGLCCSCWPSRPCSRPADRLRSLNK